MIESYLLILLGQIGLALFIFGVWLFWRSKDIEKKVYSNYDPNSPDWRSPTGWLGIWTWAHGRGGPYAPWGRYNIRPFAYLCMVVGIVFLGLFTVSVI